MAKQTAKASTAQPKAPKRHDLPQTREALLDLHRDTRKRRNKAKHGSPEHVEAIDLLGQIEVRSPASSGRWTRRSADRSSMILAR